MHYYQTDDGIESRTRANGSGQYLGFFPSVDREIRKFPKWNGKALVLDTTARNKAAVTEVSRAVDLLRIERDRRLTASDWAVLPDVKLTEDESKAVIAYRQALRDFPATKPDLASPAWPEVPAVLEVSQ